MASRRALGLAYVYPAFLLLLAAASLAYGYGSRLGLFRPTSRFAVRPLESEPYYAFELVAFLLLALLAYRAVSRARAGKDVWTMRAYWPVVLGTFAALTLVAYAFTLPTRGCDVGPAYAAYGCWDPTVTFFRLALAAVVTGGFTHLVARLAGGPSAPRPAKKTDAPEAPPPERVEEIRAR